MKHRAPAARWVATATVIAVLMVLTVLAVRLKLGDDPAIGAVSAKAGASSSSTDDGGSSVQDLFGDGGTSGSEGSVPSSPPTSRVS